MKAAVIMGSKSDLPIVKETIKTLKEFEIETEAHVISAHRTPEQVARYASNAKNDGIEVIIAAAGKAAHLAGVIASHTTLPVIGIPISSPIFDGMDALLATVQMPPGIPVATVSVDAGANAALLAIQILSLKYNELANKLTDYKKELIQKVEKADKELKEEIAQW